MVGRNLVGALALLWLLSALIGCGTSRNTRTEQPAPEAAGGLAGALPAPSDVTRGVSDPGGSTVPSMHYLAGHAQRCDTPVNTLVMSPDFDAQNPDLTGLAYAMYEFNAPATGWPAILLNWAEQPEEGNSAYLGLANFETNRWDFFLDTGGPCRPQAREPYLDAEDKMLAVVLAVGTQQRELRTLFVNPFDPERDVAEIEIIAAGYPRVEHVKLLTLDGRPAAFIAWANELEDEPTIELGVDMVLATDAAGTSWGEPRTLISVTPHTSESFMTGNSLSATMLNGAPALLWHYAEYMPNTHGTLVFLRGLDSRGDAWAAPQVVYDHPGATYLRVVHDFAAVDGRPAYTYRHWDPALTTHMPHFHIAADAEGTNWPAAHILPRPGMHVTLFGLLPETDGTAELFAEVWNPGGDVRRYLYESNVGGTVWTEREILTGRIGMQPTMLAFKLADGRPANVVKDTDSHDYQDLGQNFHLPADTDATVWPAEPLALSEPLPGVRHTCAVLDSRPLLVAVHTDQTDTLLHWTSAADPACSGWNPMRNARLPIDVAVQSFAITPVEGYAVMAFALHDDLNIQTTSMSMDVCVARIPAD